MRSHPGLRSDGGGGEEEREGRAGESAVSTPGAITSKFRQEKTDAGMPEKGCRVRVDP